MEHSPWVEKYRPTEFDEIVLDTHDTTSVTVICGDGSFELPIIRENFGVESVRFGPNGLDLDISSFELEDVSGFISQMLMYRGGRVGLFLSVFFGLHPDVVFLNFGAKTTFSGIWRCAMGGFRHAESESEVKN